MILFSYAVKLSWYFVLCVNLIINTFEEVINCLFNKRTKTVLWRWQAIAQRFCSLRILWRNAFVKSINKIWKRIAVILFFYLINFGLWELIAPIISDEWASFMVYVILFLIVIALFHRELKEEWDFIRNTKLTDKKYYVGLIITLIIELVLTLVMLWIAQNVWVEILPANNENVKNQMASVPVILSVIQGCVLAPVIEEMTFRYGIIGKTKSKYVLFVTTVISIVLFDCIHIVSIPEFFYYIVPSVILTLFYVRHRNVFASIMLHSLINIVGYLSLLIDVL